MGQKNLASAWGSNMLNHPEDFNQTSSTKTCGWRKNLAEKCFPLFAALIDTRLVFQGSFGSSRSIYRIFLVEEPVRGALSFIFTFTHTSCIHLLPTFGNVCLNFSWVISQRFSCSFNNHVCVLCVGTIFSVVEDRTESSTQFFVFDRSLQQQQSWKISKETRVSHGFPWSNIVSHSPQKFESSCFISILVLRLAVYIFFAA